MPVASELPIAIEMGANRLTLPSGARLGGENWADSEQNGAYCTATSPTKVGLTPKQWLYLNGDPEPGPLV